MSSIERTFSLQVPSNTENLAMIRDFVNGIGTRAGLGAADVARMELAVDEACANVIEHAYGPEVTKEVSVRATIDDEMVQIDVVDTGKGFDPSTISDKNLEQLVAERRSGGLGMRLIKTVMDEVHYEVIPGEKNELRMIKRLKKSSP
ncbi:MAG TPA: ATP-binding protein [Bryobacteraceae bacterium]|nr:ATP-binding protein [Bryobacteraceae bacterium]